MIKEKNLIEMMTLMRKRNIKRTMEMSNLDRKIIILLLNKEVYKGTKQR